MLFQIDKMNAFQTSTNYRNTLITSRIRNMMITMKSDNSNSGSSGSSTKTTSISQIKSELAEYLIIREELNLGPVLKTEITNFCL